MNVTPLKYLLFIENVTTVFRNYLCYKKIRTRILIILWVVLESANITTSVYANFTSKTEFQVKAQRIYFFTSTGFSIYVMIAALYYSKRFYRLILNFDAFYNILDDKIFKERMEKAQKVLTVMVVLFSGIKMSTFAYIRASHWAEVKTVLLITLSQYSISMSDFRYFFQYFIFNSVMFVISEQLRATTRSIEGELSGIKESRRNVEHADNLPSVSVNHEKLQTWMKAYENINDSSNLCSIIFRAQLTIMLSIVVVYYIILLYNFAIITVEGVTSVPSMIMNAYSMTVFLMALYMTSGEGQKIQNNYTELRQKLCKLCVYTLENEEYYKLVKDLLRYVRTRPVRMHVCGFMDINMSMLPSVVAFFTSYTVIVLQFNNVL